jgi:hypothetical protein
MQVPALEASFPVMVPPTQWHVIQHSIRWPSVVKPQQQPEQAAIVDVGEAVSVRHNLQATLRNTRMCSKSATSGCLSFDVESA